MSQLAIDLRISKLSNKIVNRTVKNRVKTNTPSSNQLKRRNYQTNKRTQLDCK